MSNWSSDPVEMEAQLKEMLLDRPTAWYEGLDAGIRQAADDLLPGSIDFHVHCDPSPARRRVDAFTASEQASDAGMRAIVLKDHHADMGDVLWLVRDHAKIKPPFEAHGSLWLNNHVGGWNPWAVDKAILFGTRLISGPTVAAYGQLVTMAKASGSSGEHPADVLVKTARPPKKASIVYTLDEDGKCRPEVIECLDIIAAAGNVVLGTGHLDKNEVFTLVRTAHKRGVERFCMTHVPITGASIEELRDLCAETGAVCEYMGGQVRRMGEGAADALRTIGLDHVTLSTDAGFYLTPAPTEAYKHGIAALLEAGLSEEEVEQVAHVTPARLLEVPVPAVVAVAS